MYANFPPRALIDPTASADCETQALDPAAAQQTLNAIHSNVRLARNLLDHINSDDPGARELPAPRRELLRERCVHVLENRGYRAQGGTPAPTQPAAMPKGVPLPIREWHRLMSEEDRSGLDEVTRELATESRHQLTRSLAPLRQELAVLEAACRSLCPPLHLPLCPKMSAMLDQLAQVREDDVTSLAIGPVVKAARGACSGFQSHLTAVQTLGSLQQELGLTKAATGPGTAINKVTWIKARDALLNGRWDEFRTQVAALSRLQQPAPVLHARPATSRP
ncbi:hypothetical protein [Roseateles terrae]|uniref:Uncharacterized protein n=1 Tax=Roseateles terrae TaxID=431060 RepID=A0ABR6GNC8_9BURK|nr:hypothetical protein [Roseateles terrae]MBB3193623.1 hypothetical protein [Roseateles terrae]OWQ89214.1 hypothetical protein CDN98_01275 [Roseateles terrae]